MSDEEKEKSNVEEKKDMTENEYLELANQFQATMNEKNLEIESYKREYVTIVKNFISLYGMLRVMDHMIQNGNVEMELAVLIECARGFASDCVDEVDLPLE